MITLKEGITNTDQVWTPPLSSSGFFDGSSGLQSLPAKAGSSRTFTLSMWLKFATSINTILASATYQTANYFILGRNADNKLWAGDREASTWNWIVESDDIFMDETAWYHVVLAVDTTASLSADRVRLFVNGNAVGIHQVQSNRMYPLQNDLCQWNNQACTHNLGASNINLDTNSFPFQGYMANVHCIDGASLDPSHFGKWSTAVPGLWTAAPGSPEPGPNGSHLTFADAADMGADRSANEAHWSCVGSIQQTTDTPSSNKAVFNTLTPGVTNISYTNGNRAITSTGPSTAISTIFVDRGKWYAEFEAAGPASLFGIHRASNDYAGTLGSKAGGYGYAGTGELHIEGTVSAYAEPYAAGDIIGVLLDLDGGSLSFTKNGAYQGVAATGLTGMYGFAAGDSLEGGTSLANFGAVDFAYEPAEGFAALCTENLPMPLIQDARTAAQIILRTGTTNTVLLPEMTSGPDLVLSKSRDESVNWQLVDTERGEYNVLSINTTEAQHYDSESILLNSYGYSIGTSPIVNAPGQRHMDICLRAGINEGLSILRYTGDGTSGRTIPHGLGKAPGFIMIKGLDTSDNWFVYHHALGADRFLVLNSDAPAQNVNAPWGGITPDAIHITLGDNAGVNGAGNEYVAYAFAASDIFQPFTYRGNGSVDGPLIPLRGRPLAVPFLKGAGTSDWIAQDACRDPFNPATEILWPNLASAAVASITPQINFLSQGMKIATTASTHNSDEVQYVGLAILASTNYSNAC